MNKFKAHSCTAPAASLYPYYKRNEIVKTFIIVTDEEENTNYEGKNSSKNGLFADIFNKYRTEVYPAKLVFVSFLRDNKDGFMVRQLKNTIPGIEKDIIQFIMSQNNPDLRKLDELLNILSMDTNFYNDKCLKIIDEINSCCEELLFDKENIDNLLDTNNNIISICI